MRLGYGRNIPSNIVGRPNSPNGAVVGIEDGRDVNISLVQGHRRYHRHCREEPDEDIRDRNSHDEID